VAKFGGGTPLPARCGGGHSRAQVITNSLNAARGTAYDVSRTSTVYVENMAAGRAIAAAWATNGRLAALGQPGRCAGANLARWERILTIRPTPGTPEATRRATAADRLAQFGTPATRTALLDRLSRVGPCFVALEYLPLAVANINVPVASPAYPFGVTTAGYWSSDAASVYVRMQTAPGQTEAQYRNAVGVVVAELDAILPAWVQIVVYRPGPVYAAISGGPTAAGFYVDDLHNLDNEILLS
jgi:hypothetical protein